MQKTRRTVLFKAITVLLCISLMCPCVAAAEVQPDVQPYGSYYLNGYQTYVCPVGGGQVQVWYNVIGAGTQDELGTLRIMLYESTDNQNWTLAKAFLHENYSNMLAYNSYRHISYVTYQGVAGRYYKAYVCIWGGSDGKGDTRYVWTSSQQAT